MTPITTAADSQLPDPRRPDTPMPTHAVQALLPGNAVARPNHVPKATDADRRAFEQTGADVVESEEGLLVLEVMAGQAPTVAALCRESGACSVEVRLDLAEIERVVTARWA